MRIYSMTATFGKLENRTLTLQPGLNVIEAPNEWGKSTWCAFLTAMLYGIDTRERSTPTVLAAKERYLPWSGKLMEGRIELCWEGRDITIQRTTRGRIPMGEFKAYETASGVAVPELTADNCGQLLLGVEKSVFLRSAFVRLQDMPITQDEALRRRLHDLVTTGDESSQSDDLAQQLRDLKNKVRSNRSNGLLPQALAEKAGLEEKLQQLGLLQAQEKALQQRQTELSNHVAQLRNHQNTLAWKAAQNRLEALRETKAKLAAATDQVTGLAQACAALPSGEELQQQLEQEKLLQTQKESIQLELAMLPTPPVPPQALAPHDPVQAEKDFAAYQALSQITPPGKGQLIAAIGSLVLALAGMVLLWVSLRSKSLLLPILGGCLFTIFGLAAAVCGRSYRSQNRAYQHTCQQLQSLMARYAPLPAEQWISAANNYVNQNAQYRATLAAYEANRTRLQNALQQVLSQLSSLPATDGHSDALQKRRSLADAQKEQQHLQQLVQTLASGEPLPEKPTAPDTLTLSEEKTQRLLAQAELESRQLHTRLGQVQGQMEALGSTEVLQSRLQAVNTRLTRLEQTYAALELAQNTLAQATTELQRKFAPAITAKAKDYFSRITACRYDKLTLTRELAVETSSTEESATRKSQYRSDGTVDQLYLALRLAVADALIPHSPLVLDDALVRFDDTRLAAALTLLKQQSQRRQVLLFTCQGREQKYI